MEEARNLLFRLLEYIREQAKEIDPRGYCLDAAKGFVRFQEDIAGLPGVEFDLKVAGDHVWLRVERLAAGSPPAVPERDKGLLRISSDPDGPSPSLNEAAFLHWLVDN